MFKNRVEAGKLLGERLLRELEAEKKELIVLSIPRGGAVIGSEVAGCLACPHDVIVTKKLRAPMQEELALGAIGETSGSLYVNKRLVDELGIANNYLKKEIVDRQREIKRREELYRQGREALHLQDRVVIIVDDGVATGATMIAAAREVWNRKPKKVIIGLPVIAKDTLGKLEKEVDAVIFIEAPEMFYAVGQFYEDFPQLEDEEVIELLK